jgi:hypothetical protein
MNSQRSSIFFSLSGEILAIKIPSNVMSVWGSIYDKYRTAILAITSKPPLVSTQHPFGDRHEREVTTRTSPPSHEVYNVHSCISTLHVA